MCKGSGRVNLSVNSLSEDIEEKVNWRKMKKDTTFFHRKT